MWHLVPSILHFRDLTSEHVDLWPHILCPYHTTTTTSLTTALVTPGGTIMSWMGKCEVSGEERVLVELSPAIITIIIIRRVNIIYHRDTRLKWPQYAASALHFAVTAWHAIPALDCFHNFLLHRHAAPQHSLPLCCYHVDIVARYLQTAVTAVVSHR